MGVVSLSEKAIKHIKDKWVTHDCGLCNKNDWDISDDIFKLYRDDMATMPFVTVICTNCGNTVLINAIVAEII